MNKSLGIDIGGTGIKSSLVDTEQGQLISELRYDETPSQLSPSEIAELLSEIIDSFLWAGPVGIGFPGVVINGQIRSAAHLSPKWIDTDARQAFSRIFPNRFVILNDADAAGLAEMRYGAGRPMNNDRAGVALMLTFGTGIGSALFVGGRLVPNTEMGHLRVGDDEAENIASGKVKTTLGLDWPEWSERVNLILIEYEKLFSPELIIIGGGVSENFDTFSIHLKTRGILVAAELQNNAGLIGAALAAS